MAGSEALTMGLLCKHAKSEARLRLMKDLINMMIDVMTPGGRGDEARGVPRRDCEVTNPAVRQAHQGGQRQVLGLQGQHSTMVIGCPRLAGTSQHHHFRDQDAAHEQSLV